MTEKAVWRPDPEYIKSTRLFQWMKSLGFSDYADFLKASTDDIAWFWEEAEKALGISWFHRYDQALNTDGGIKWPKWFSGGSKCRIQCSRKMGRSKGNSRKNGHHLGKRRRKNGASLIFLIT